jgi:hypothetical protein
MSNTLSNYDQEKALCLVTMPCSLCKELAPHKSGKSPKCIACDNLYKQNFKTYGKVRYWPKKVVDHYYRNSTRKHVLHPNSTATLDDNDVSIEDNPNWLYGA